MNTNAVSSLVLLLGLAAAGCGPAHILPAVGTTLKTDACYVTAQGVSIQRTPWARCPDRADVERVTKRVLRERRGVELRGARVLVIDGLVECADGVRHGCAVGDDVTVSDGFGVIASIEHELSHVAVYRGGNDPREQDAIDEKPDPRTSVWNRF